MLSNWKWARIALITLLTAGLLSGGLVWGKKPPKPPPEPPINYEITWLTSPLGTYPIAWDIDNHGNVVGATGGEAFLYSPENGMQNLNDLAGPASGWVLTDAFGINDYGQVVGLGNPNNQRGNFGFRFTPGFVDEQEIYVPPFVERMALPEAAHSVAGAINDLGEVVGESHDAAGNKTVFVYSYSWDLDEWQMTNLGIEPGEPAYDFGINNFGQVAGTTRAVGSVRTMVFRYTPGLGIETTTLFNDPFISKMGWSHACDINDAGQFTGSAPLSQQKSHVFRFSDQSGMVDLDDARNSTSNGCAVNSHGDVVGSRTLGRSWGYDILPRGFLYTDEYGMVNLDDLVVGTPEDLEHWMTRRVNITAMNDSGQICGFLYLPETPQMGFVLTPVLPTP